VLKAIKDGDTSDAKWYLTKKGKKRGYGDAIELMGEGGGDIKIQVVDYRRGLAALAPEDGE
jgi:hypothetical protein